MCGIVGVLRYGDLGDKNNRMSALYLATILLELTETRGKDATGVAALFDDGNFFGQKMAVRASEFVGRFGGGDGDFDGLQSVLRDYEASSLRTIIGHCRKSSVGGKWDNVNNHPIKAGNIIGIHNGTLKNQDIIFKNLDCDRDGTVDSEAIFRMFQYYTKNCQEPFTLDMVEEVTKRLEGTFSILAFNANNPNQVVAARDGRPAEFCFIKPLNMVLVASEKKFFETAVWEYNKMAWNYGIDWATKLKASDVETIMLKDDTIALFDLTTEITKDTKITDLYTTRDVPKVADRIWKTPVKTTSYNTGYQGRHNGTANKSAAKTQTAGSKADDKEDKKSGTTTHTKTTTSATQTSQDTKSDDKAKDGLVWNDNLNKYVKHFGNMNENQGHTVVDAEKKRAMSPDEAFKSVKKDDDEVTDTIVIKNEDTGEENYGADEEDDGLTFESTPVEHFQDKKGVRIYSIEPVEPKNMKEDTSVSKKGLPEDAALTAMKETAKRADKNELNAAKAAADAKDTLKKFISAEEVATLCDTDVVSLERLPIVALANRLLIAQFSEIFAAGYMAKCEEVSANKQENRLSRSQKHIRTLKGVTALVSGALIDEVSEDTMSDLFKTWADTGFVGELTSENLKDVFNTGDLRANKVIRTMVSALDNTDR